MKLIHIILISAAAAAAAACVLVLAACARQGGSDAKDAVLTFSSFDGGGPEYTAKVADPAIVSCESEKKYKKPDHEELTGAGFEVRFTLRGLRPGKTTLTVSARSPIAENFDKVYDVTVADDLSVTAEPVSEKSLDETDPIQPVPQLMAEINGAVFCVDHAGNAAAEELIGKLSSGVTEIELNQEGEAERSGKLPWSLTYEKAETDAGAGDILLRGADKISLCTGAFRAECERLGSIYGITGEALAEAKSVKLWVEWSE